MPMPSTAPPMPPPTTTSSPAFTWPFTTDVRPSDATTSTVRASISCVSGSVSTITKLPPAPSDCTAEMGTMSAFSMVVVVMVALAVMPGLRRGSGSAMSSFTAYVTAPPMPPYMAPPDASPEPADVVAMLTTVAGSVRSGAAVNVTSAV